jgi:hypothetical protein
MRQRKLPTTTLGDLIAMVIDGITPLVKDPVGVHFLASRIVSDLLNHDRAHLEEIVTKYSNVITGTEP